MEAEVDYGLNLDSHASCTRTPSDAGTYIYKCDLSELEPGLAYGYRIRAGGGESPGGLFTTAASEA